MRFCLALYIAASLVYKLAAANLKPNILVLFADDLGHADIGVYGAPTTTTPNIDALANEGVKFTAWYSGFHICSPSRAAMMTGRLCIRSGTCGGSYLGGVFGNSPKVIVCTIKTLLQLAHILSRTIIFCLCFSSSRLGSQQMKPLLLRL